jgi:ADP-ribosylglycohydrolase
MLGAITGDIIGSVHEFCKTKRKEFSLFTPLSTFTDDTVLTVAIADALLNRRDYVDVFHEYYRRYPRVSYGRRYRSWAQNGNREPYGSYGNGSAMRVSPVAYAFDNLDEVLTEAKRSAAVTHNHPEGIKGAQATAAAIFLARTGHTKAQIQSYVAKTFTYDLDRDIDAMRETYSFDETCQGTVPEAIISFLASTDFEDAIRNAISLGGDADTLACITGAIAEPFYGGVPRDISRPALRCLDERLRNVIRKFQRSAKR